MRIPHALRYIPACAALAAGLFVTLAPEVASARGFYGQGAYPTNGFAINAVPVGKAREAENDGVAVKVRESHNNDVGFAVPDTEGGLIWVPTPSRSKGKTLTDARELKLKVRELASQLIANMDPMYRNFVALPTSFVNQENLSQTSTLGRFMAEQLQYEFNQRGFPVREYRLGSAVRPKGNQGEFMLTRNVKSISAKTPGMLFVVGTYYIDPQAVFVNARLVHGDGTVVRSAQLVMPNSSITRRMLASGKNGSAGVSGAKRAMLPIEDFKTVTQPTNLTPFDTGEDIH